MNCAEYLVDFLIKHGVTDVFGYSGGYIVPFIDALYDRKGEINVHVCYNEQGCAYAADGFARTSGKLGVYFTTSGPGAVNSFGGLADCWFDGVPIMAITSALPGSGFSPQAMKSVLSAPSSTMSPARSGRSADWNTEPSGRMHRTTCG